MQSRLNQLILVLSTIVVCLLAAIVVKNRFWQPSTVSQSQKTRPSILAENRKTQFVPNTKKETIYYIDSRRGDNSFSGRQIERPWKDFSNIEKNHFSGGSVIRLKRGETWHTPIKCPPGGTPKMPIRINSYGEGPLPRIDVRRRHKFAILLNVSHVSISDIRLENALRSAIYVYGEHKKQNLHFTGLEINNSGRSAIEIFREAQEIDISDCTIENSGKNAITFHGPGLREKVGLTRLKIFNTGQNGIAVGKGGRDFTISHCSIENAKNNGIWLGGSQENKLSDVRVNNCHIKYVGMPDGGNDGITIHQDAQGNTAGTNFVIQDNVSEFCYEQGFDISSGRHVLLMNNKSRNNGQGGIIVGHSAGHVTVIGHSSMDEPTHKTSAAVNLMTQHPGNVRLYRSIIKGSGYHSLRIATGNVSVVNNTFIQTGKIGNPVNLKGKIDNVVFLNNIVASSMDRMGRIRFLESSRPPGHETFLFDYNIYHSPGKKVVFYHNHNNFPLETLKNRFSTERHSMEVDPQFSAPLNGNYKVKSESPAIDAGRHISMVLRMPSKNRLNVEAPFCFFGPFDSKHFQTIVLADSRKIYRIREVTLSPPVITLDRDLETRSGEKISLTFKGNAVDIGAYEYDKPATP